MSFDMGEGLGIPFYVNRLFVFVVDYFVRNEKKKHERNAMSEHVTVRFVLFLAWAGGEDGSLALSPHATQSLRRRKSIR